MSGTSTQLFSEALEATSWRGRIQLQTIGSIGVAGPILVGYAVSAAVGAIRQNAYFSRLGLSYVEWGLNPLALALTSVFVLLLTTSIALLYLIIFLIAMLIRRPELTDSQSLVRRIRRSRGAGISMLLAIILYGIYFWFNPVGISLPNAFGLAVITIVAVVNSVILYSSLVARRHRTAATQVGQQPISGWAPSNFALTLVIFNVIGAVVQLIVQQQAGIEDAERLMTSSSASVTILTVDAIPQYEGRTFGLVTTTSDAWVFVEQQDTPVDKPVIYIVPSMQIQSIITQP